METQVNQINENITHDNITPYKNLLEFNAWLQYHIAKTNIKVTNNGKRHLIKRRLNNRFCFELDSTGTWIFAVCQIDSLRWFEKTSWTIAKLYASQNIFSLVADKYQLPAIPNILKGRNLDTPIILDFQIHPLITKELKHCKKLQIGVFSNKNDKKIIIKNLKDIEFSLAN